MKTIILTMVALILFSSRILAKEISLDSEGGAVTGIKLVSDKVLTKRIGGVASLELNADVAKIIATDVETPMGTFTQLTIPGYHQSETIGAPSLPVMNQLIEIPFGANVAVEVVDCKMATHNLSEFGIVNKIIPRQPPRPKDGSKLKFVFEKRAYITSGFHQNPIAKIYELGALRHINLALLSIAPVSYDPSTNKVEFYTDVKVRVLITKGDMKRTMDIKSIYSSSVFNFIYRRVISPYSLRLLNKRSNSLPIHYAIVADGKFRTALDQFIEWKTLKGFDVSVGYTDEIGSTKEEIQAYIHNLYNNPVSGKAAPEFLLLVGDHDNLPAFHGRTGIHITDLDYIAVTEGDRLPDILTGRFSAKTIEELLPQINKTIEYEKYEFADPSFLERATMIAGWDYRHTIEWGWPHIKYGLANYVNSEHGIPVQNVYQSTGAHQNETSIYEKINDGCSFVNYTAHGGPKSWTDPQFTITEITALSNCGKYPLIIGNCCLTNKFETDTCFGEAWLRAEKRGAIGYIGGSNTTTWDEDIWWGNGFFPIQHPNPEGLPPAKEDTGTGAYDYLFEDTMSTCSGIIVAGNLAVEESNSSLKTYYWEIYHLMGDPALQIYLGVPSATEVEFTEQPPAGATKLEINAPSGAYVGVTVDGKLHGASTIDSSGSASIDLIPLPTCGEVKVVVTGKNIRPYIGTTTIAD